MLSTDASKSNSTFGTFSDKCYRGKINTFSLIRKFVLSLKGNMIDCCSSVIAWTSSNSTALIFRAKVTAARTYMDMTMKNDL